MWSVEMTNTQRNSRGREMKKQEIATLLAEAMNILNDVQALDEVDYKLKGQIHNLFAKFPQQILVDADFANNGSIVVKDLM